MQALQEAPLPKKMFWLSDLNKFKGWQDFVKWLKKERGAICFTHKTTAEVPDAYDGQRIVVFCLEGCKETDNIKPVLRRIADLKRGLHFCSVRGVQMFERPHVVVFADFPMPEKSKRFSRTQSTTEAKDKSD